MLLAPAFFSLTGFLFGLSENGPMLDVGTAIGFANCVAGLLCSIYCGIWLARRFRRPGERVLSALGFILGIGLVNFCIVAAGCVPTALRGAHFY